MGSKTFFSSVVKATALSLCFGLSGILAFAAVVKFTDLDQTVIKTVNQFIKVVSVFVGCFFSVRGKAGILKGLISGVLFTVIIYALFALMSGAALFGLDMLADLGFTAVVGAISGVVAVNLRGKEE